MQVFKQVSYVQILKGWQTYVFPVSGGFLRYKLLTTSQELEEAKERCHLEGWKIIDATRLVKQLNKISR
ncbi:hypothetical protein PCC9214_05612 [Planktothrix tepida]|uniref:Uncharacterized protein n=1 Tax=Planktothrix tepida PCC 9214 TaxID=671072 RepID=A0A1J1LSD5_9CYAN|nr:hypothetical protein [Planktothrix tepida]CAD5989609.1 hypothetical protein PCC9214_05612 [Planktothrix tepida]CUR35515.1 conserved hypothetical protein [Planktothrix tepida PCC 9214]